MGDLTLSFPLGAETMNLINKRKERLKFDWVLNLDTDKNVSENCLQFQDGKCFQPNKYGRKKLLKL